MKGKSNEEDRNELFMSKHKKLSDTIDKRISNFNRNINVIQLENKNLRKQIETIAIDKTNVVEDVKILKTSMTNIIKSNENNRLRLIEVERTLSSEFHTSQTAPSQNSNNTQVKPLKTTIDLLVIGSSIVRDIDAKQIEKRN